MRGFIPIAACVLAAGCANHEVTTAEYDEVARIVGATVALPDGGGVAGSVGDAARLARGELPAGFQIDASSGMATGSHFGLGYTYMVFCADANGTQLAPCGSETATATVLGSWKGAFALDGFAGSVRRQGTWKLTVLPDGSATIAGPSDLVMDATFGSGDVFHATWTEQAALELDMMRAAVAGGTLSASVIADRTLEASHGTQRWSYDITADVTFVSARTATLVLDGTRSYRIDLATGAISAEP